MWRRHGGLNGLQLCLISLCFLVLHDDALAPDFILRFDQRWLIGRLVAILVVHKHGLALKLRTARLRKQRGFFYVFSPCFESAILKACEFHSNLFGDSLLVSTIHLETYITWI